MQCKVNLNQISSPSVSPSDNIEDLIHLSIISSIDTTCTKDWPHFSKNAVSHSQLIFLIYFGHEKWFTLLIKWQLLMHDSFIGAYIKFFSIFLIIFQSFHNYSIIFWAYFLLCSLHLFFQMTIYTNWWDHACELET